MPDGISVLLVAEVVVDVFGVTFDVADVELLEDDGLELDMGSAVVCDVIEVVVVDGSVVMSYGGEVSEEQADPNKTVVERRTRVRPE